MFLRLFIRRSYVKPVVSIEENRSLVKTILVASIERNIDNLQRVVYNTQSVYKMCKKEENMAQKKVLITGMSGLIGGIVRERLEGNVRFERTQSSPGRGN